MGPTAGTGGTASAGETQGGTGGPSEAGSAGTGGEPDLCQAGDERLCSCAPGYGGKQTCSPFGWNLCSCPDWPPDGGAGTSGTGGTNEPMTGAWWAPCSSPELCDTGLTCQDGRCSFDCRAWTGTMREFSAALLSQCESLGGTCSADSPWCEG